MRHSPVTANINAVSFPCLFTNSLANAIDDTAEPIRGRIDHDRAHGDETCNTLGDRWNSLQAFMGAAS